MDAIAINGIRCYGYTGVLPEEKILGQWFEVDLTLWLDLTAPGTSDRLEDTIDYREAIAIVKDLIKNSRFDLVEKLTSEIATKILSLDRLQKVRVQLSKLAAPIPDFPGKITIDLTREK
jgi:dihydroneopterin aldolase